MIRPVSLGYVVSAVVLGAAVGAAHLSARALQAQSPAPAAASAATSAAAPAATVTAAQAAPFLGDWTVVATGQMGPANFNLSVTLDGAKIQAKMSSDQMPEQAITDISKSGASLVLKYSFDYQGNAVPVVVTLTPDGDKLQVAFDFAAGQFQMPGTGTKKT